MLLAPVRVQPHELCIWCVHNLQRRPVGILKNAPSVLANAQTAAGVARGPGFGTSSVPAATGKIDIKILLVGAAGVVRCAAGACAVVWITRWRCRAKRASFDTSLRSAWASLTSRLSVVKSQL